MFWREGVAVWSRIQLARQAWSQSWLLGGRLLPSAWCQLHSTPSQSRLKTVRQCSTRWGSELFQELHDFMVMSQPQTILWVVDEINRIKNTTGFYSVDELVSLLQLYTVGGPNLTSVSGTWQSLKHTNLLHSFLFLSQSLTSLLTQTKRTWKN